ncbi:MAG: glycosyltransferase family 4 protein [Coriobacteriia bacterium]|nr:glycosyltransferase family 4 protein [Coriobacteriia bacterium]
MADDGSGREAPAGLRVLFLNAFPGPGMGGGEVQTLHLVRGLVERGVAVGLVCPPAELAERARDAGARVHEHRFSASDLVVGHYLVRRIAARGSFTVIHGTGYLTNIVARHARVPGRLAVVNTVHVMPGASMHETGSRLELAARRLLDRASLDRADAVVAVSSAVAQALSAARLAPPSGVRIIPNAVDAPALELAAAEGIAGLPSGVGPLVGFLGRLERVKAPEVFVRACAELASRRSDVRFAIAGSGSMAREVAEGLRRCCEQRAAVLGTVTSAAAFMRALSVLVVPSRSEAFSLVALEAMALGVPVVATDVGGLGELVRDSEAGLLVPPEDHVAIADAVERLLDDEPLRTRMAAAGRLYAEGFTIDRMVEQYLDVYRWVLERICP